MSALAAVAEVVAVSSLYETAPIGGPVQDDYLNAVVIVEGEASARDLLEAGKAAEVSAGREQRVRWGPRTLDVDVLLHGERVVEEPGLKVPHPRMAERRFVLEPLVEVWPDAEAPGLGRVSDLLEGVMEQEVRVLAGPGWASIGS